MFPDRTTERLVLRDLEPSDAQALYQYRSTPDVSRYQSWEPSSVEKAEDFIRGLENAEPDTPGTWYQIGIGLLSDRRLIGDCGLHVHAGEPRHVEFGITIDPAYQRRGFAMEAVRSLLDYNFSSLGKHRVSCSVDPQNQASMKLMLRLGFRQEAYFVKSVWSKDHWADDVIFAMLHSEWAAETGTDHRD